jgi:hypothetical protein
LVADPAVLQYLLHPPLLVLVLNSKKQSGGRIIVLYQLPWVSSYTLKKVIDFPVPSRNVTNQTLPDWELKTYSRPRRVWYVTSQMGTKELITLTVVVDVAPQL